MRLPFIAGFFLALFASGAAQATQYSYSVENGVQAMGLVNGSGEVQSTVVPPNVKSQCTGGRILISMDTVRPPQAGTVVGRALGATNSAGDIQSTFDADPDAAHHFFGTNDDDIITLANGDVMLIWGVHIDAPISPKPGWFDLTYANAGLFGPGARRGSIVYRSTDCGNSFHYMSTIDPAHLGDGLCANPQPFKTAPPPNATYANGGSDGQLSKASGNTIYFTMDCVGRLRDTTKSGWVISGNYVKRVYALRSTDEGANWTTLGFIPGLTGWRMGVAPMTNGNVAFGLYNFLTFGKKQTNGKFTFDGSATATPIAAGWSDGVDPSYASINGTRIAANALLTRTPGGSDLVLAYPATVTDSNGKKNDGYQMYVFDPSNNQFGQAQPIFPAIHSPGHFLMHMVAIDPGSGPILLYWYDVDGNTKTASIRGRLVYENGSYSTDFAVATTTFILPPKYPKPQIVTYSFATNSAWYGDYHTAGGYAWNGITQINKQLYQYYPMWVQSDGNAHYSHVSVTRDSTAQIGIVNKGPYILYPLWKPGPPPVEIAKVMGELRARSGEPYEPDEKEFTRLKLTPMTAIQRSRSP